MKAMSPNGILKDNFVSSVNLNFSSFFNWYCLLGIILLVFFYGYY